MNKVHKQDFESPSPHYSTNSKSLLWKFLEMYGDKKRDKKFKGVRFVHSGKKWFIEYYFRIPEELKEQYNNKVWLRFKLYKDINREKSLQYGYQLRDAMQEFLEQGYNPFEKQQISLTKEDEPKEWTIQQSFYYFIQKWEDRGLEKVSVIKYKRTANRFLKWLDQRNHKHQPIDILNIRHIESYLSECKKSLAWENRSYNNELTFLNTIFNFLVKYSISKKNPCIGIDKQVVITKKHKYYDERLFSRVKNILSIEDPYLLFACQVVYYLCIRSEKELKHFKVGNIFEDRKQVLITAADSKTNQDRYIPCCDEMIRIFKEKGILDYPPDYYVFSVPHHNKFIADGKPGSKPFGSGFFSKRFSKIRKKLGLTEDHTLFSFRHTRAVHLKLDGCNDVDIQHLMGHNDFATTARYLRNIGLSVNAENLNVKSRRF